jgi:hypothetical protein
VLTLSKWWQANGSKTFYIQIFNAKCNKILLLLPHNIPPGFCEISFYFLSKCVIHLVTGGYKIKKTWARKDDISHMDVFTYI